MKVKCNITANLSFTFRSCGGISNLTRPNSCLIVQPRTKVISQPYHVFTGNDWRCHHGRFPRHHVCNLCFGTLSIQSAGFSRSFLVNSARCPPLDDSRFRRSAADIQHDRSSPRAYKAVPGKYALSVLEIRLKLRYPSAPRMIGYGTEPRTHV